MFNRIGIRHSEARASEETQADRSMFHARPTGLRERATLHETMVPTGLCEPMDDAGPSGPHAAPAPHALGAPEPAIEARPEPVPTPAAGPAGNGDGRDRRASCRYQVSDAHGVLCWWEAVADDPAPVAQPERPSRMAETSIYSAVMARGPAFRNVQAMRESAEARREAAAPKPKEAMKLRYSNGEVVDISQTGMALLCHDAPPPNQKIWLRLERPNPTDWVEVLLKGVSATERAPKLVRVAFREACPYDFFKIAVYAKPKP